MLQDIFGGNNPISNATIVMEWGSNLHQERHYSDFESLIVWMEFHSQPCSPAHDCKCWVILPPHSMVSSCMLTQLQSGSSPVYFIPSDTRDSVSTLFAVTQENLPTPTRPLHSFSWLLCRRSSVRVSEYLSSPLDQSSRLITRLGGFCVLDMSEHGRLGTFS